MRKLKIKKKDGFPDYLIINGENYTGVYSLKTNSFIGQKISGSGYKKVALMDEQGQPHWYWIHRLIYQAFIGDIPQGYTINHKNEDKTDNRPQNLEAMTIQQNLAYGTRNQRISQSMRGKRKSKNCFQVTYKGVKTIFNSITELIKEFPNEERMKWNYRLHHSKRPQESYFSLLDGQVLQITPLNDEYKERLNRKENI